MVKIYSSIAAFALASSYLVAAQTFTECDPTKRTNCAPRVGLNQAEYAIDFKQGGADADKVWKNSAKPVTFGANGAEFNLKAAGDSVTYATDFYIFFGYVEVKMRAAPGAGIVSSFVLQSDDLDEIDWEMIGSETDKVQSNYFGKGNTTTYDRGGFHNVATPADIMHTYALNWTKEATTWLIDGVPVRTVKFADAVDGKNYPQTPMNVRLGNWIAGAAGNSPGTVSWAGGITDLTKAPFNMYVESVKIRNYNPSESYHYTDLTGSWQSIKYQINADAGVSKPAVSSQNASIAAPAGVVSQVPAAPQEAQAPHSVAQGASKAQKSPCASKAADAAPGVVTITPSNNGNVNNGVSANATRPTFTIGVVSIDAASSTLASSPSLPSSIVVAAAATSSSAVVSFTLGNGTANATYSPLQVATNDAVSKESKAGVVTVLAVLSALVVMMV